MIIINGKVFRNLEEQVAYLSEMIPLFEEDNGQLIIKQGDGTEIARITLDAVSNMNVTTANDITTITITNADSTTQTFTIDMTGYLKKNTTTTTQDYAYIKKADGTQDILVIDDQLRNLSLVKRNASGGINCATPSYPNNAANKQYVDDAIAGVSSKRYNHFIELTFMDGCGETLKGFVAIENNSNVSFTSNTFKQLFSKEITVGNSSVWNVIPYVSSQFFEKTGNDRPVPCMYYYSDTQDIFDNDTYTEGGYSSGLTLSSLSDSVSEV